MAKTLLKRQALELRKLGKSYGQIRQELGVNKSTLSDWLSKYPLSVEQFALLEKNRKLSKYLGIEKTRITKQLKRAAKLRRYYDEMNDFIVPFSKKELFLSGLFLYWGEGGKTERGTVSISNTDPAVLKFSLLWITQALDIPRERIRILLHLYEDMVVDESMDYWSKALHIPKGQFVKPYIKKSKRTDLDYKGFGHGTCMLRVSNTVVKEKILMGIKAAGDYSEDYISRF